MADTWQAISGYASNNYSDTMVFEVDGATKKLQKISGQTLIAGEKNSQYIRFMMPRYWDGIDVSEKTISIIYGLAGQYYGETAAISAERTDDSLRFGWVVPEEACCIAGTLLFVLVIKDSTYVLKSQITEVPVLKSINLDDVIPEPTKETWYADFQVRVEQTLSAAENAVEVAQNTLEQARSLIGSPLVANTAEEMTDTSRIYVYTGSETGYTNGHWYYHNGSAWTDGGVYNAVAVDTDTTLSIAGKAADAKKTGDEIEQIKEDLTDLDESVVKTVNGIAPDENGNVEIETGDQEAIDELNEQMSEVLTTSYDYSGNLADTTGVEKTGQYTDYVEFDLVGDGAYYSNPFAVGINAESSASYEVNLLDSNGDVITATKVSDSSTRTNITSGTYSKVGFDINGTSLTLHVYYLNGNHQTVKYTLSAIPAKVKYRTRWWDADKAQINGFTYGYSSETYVPYSAPSKVYSPNTDFADEIKDYYIADGFIDKTLSTEGCAADAKAVGDELYDRKGISFETVNGWIRPTNGNLITSQSETATDFISVTPGEVIRVNRPNLQEFANNAYYNASKQYVSGLDTLYNVNDITIPSGVYYARFSDYNSGMVGFSVERTGLWTRIHDAIEGSGDTIEYRNLIEQSKYGTGVLTLLHFSDLHMDTSTMIYINGFRTKYAEFLDDVIQTGDVSNGFSNDWSALVSVGLGDCLGVIGNHEALGSSKNSATQQELYEKYIEPYISGWNVTQPTGVDDSTSEHYCANYYYKDYTDATIRLIVLDTQKWSSAQLSWFTDTLASARTAGYAVVVASHILPGAVTITDCNFSARYFSGGNVVHTFPTDDAPLVTEDAVSAVNDFITAGGEFTIWIGGHNHADIFGVFTNYPNVTAYMIDKASIDRETPGAARIRGEKNQHAFNVMSVMRGGKLIKIVRIGEDVDGMMRGKHVLCYNYNTKTVISQW